LIVFKITKDSYNIAKPSLKWKFNMYTCCIKACYS